MWVAKRKLKRMRDLHREEEGGKGRMRMRMGAANHFLIDFQLDLNMLRVSGKRERRRERVRSSLKS